MNENQIVKSYNAGKSTYEIAKEYNTYANKIRRILIKHGVAIKSKSDAQKNALKKGIAKIPTEGTKRSKAERLKISNSLVKRWQSMDEEEYQKYVQQAKERWVNMSEADKKKMSSLATQAIQRAGREGSKLEKNLKYELSKSGFVVEIHKKNLTEKGLC